MKTQILTLACAGSLALAGCNLTTEEQMAVGVIAGAGAGLLTANALNANSNWTILAVLAGATAGALVAKNNATGECAYAKGDGTYYSAPCY